MINEQELTASKIDCTKEIKLAAPLETQNEIKVRLLTEEVKGLKLKITYICFIHLLGSALLITGALL